MSSLARSQAVEGGGGKPGGSPTRAPRRRRGLPERRRRGLVGETRFPPRDGAAGRDTGRGGRMSGRRSADDIRAAFEERWRDGDPWDVESSELDRGSYARQVELVADRHYARALELGCGGG